MNKQKNKTKNCSSKNINKNKQKTQENLLIKSLYAIYNKLNIYFLINTYIFLL